MDKDCGKPISFRLSSAGLKNIPSTSNREKTCQIFFGKSEISLPILDADFLSLKISNLHKIDPTLFTITITSEEKASELLTKEIKEFLQGISSGEEAIINSENSYNIRFISLFLDNTELYQFITKNFPINQNDDQIIQYLIDLYQYGCDPSSIDEYDDCINYISSNFYKIEEEKILKLPKNIILSILSNKNLTVQNEDTLYDFIQKVISKSSKNKEKIDRSSFYEKIEISELSIFKIRSFYEDININDINGQIWKQFHNFFCYPLKKSKGNEHKTIEKNLNILYDSIKQDKFNGIIHYLTLKCGGNPHSKGEMIVTGTNVIPEYNYEPKLRLPHFVVDLNDEDTFYDSSTDSKNKNKPMCIEYDFKKRKVRPDCYSVRNEKKWGANPVSWTIEGKNVDSDWIELDSHNDDNALSAKGSQEIFQIDPKCKNNQFFQFLRFVCRKNCHKNAALVISALEFFGTILE